MTEEHVQWLDGHDANLIYALLRWQWDCPTLHLPADCPRCGKKGVHLYFHHAFHGRGGGWAWCSECRGFGHGDWKIPQWWRNAPEIDADLLTFEPIKLDKDKDIVDRHWNALVEEVSHRE